MPNVHPLVVHFPIALLTVSFIFDLAGIFLRHQVMERAGWWTLASGVAGLLVAVVSGLQAEHSVVIPPEAKSVFETHEEVAFIVSSLYAALLLWRIATRTRVPLDRQWIYLGLSFIGMLLIWVGAWHGGELVYTYGVGVKLGN